MSSEIERKFLLCELPERLAGRSGEAISQGYLSNGEGPEIRLREAGERKLMTVKTGSGEVREEVEFEIEATVWDSLWPLTEGRRIAKQRLREPIGAGLTLEVDVYEDELSGLIVAEVEFDSVEASRRFQPPAWLGREVTGQSGYSNRVLATTGAPPPPPRASDDAHSSRAFRIKHQGEVGPEIERIARGRAEKAIAALDETGADTTRAIHSARKDLKKLRSLLRLVRAELPKKTYRAESRRYRDAGRRLSASRDAAVKVETLAALEEHFGLELPSASAGGWLRLLRAERDEVVAAALDSEAEAVAAAREEVRTGLEAIEGWELEHGSWETIGPGLRRGYGRGREAMDRVAADPDPELVHEWRKRAKDLWYQLRLIRKAWPAQLEGAVTSTHELTDLLGDHHDLTVLAEDLAARPEVGSRERLAALIERRQEELLDAALDLGARIYAETPKAFERRLRAYWSAWR